MYHLMVLRNELRHVFKIRLFSPGLTRIIAVEESKRETKNQESACEFKLLEPVQQ